MNGALKRDMIGCVWAYCDQNKEGFDIKLQAKKYYSN